MIRYSPREIGEGGGGGNFQVCSVGISERNTRKRGGKWRARKVAVGGEEEEETGREWKTAVHRVVPTLPPPLFYG